MSQNTHPYHLPFMNDFFLELKSGLSTPTSSVPVNRMVQGVPVELFQVIICVRKNAGTSPYPLKVLIIIAHLF